MAKKKIETRGRKKLPQGEKTFEIRNIRLKEKEIKKLGGMKKVAELGKKYLTNLLLTD